MEKKIRTFDQYVLNENAQYVLNENAQEPAVCLPPPSMPHTVLILQSVLKLAHWQTYSFAQHEALGKVYDEVSRLGDELVEVYIGKYNNRQIIEGSAIGLYNVDESNIGLTADMLLGIFNGACAQLISEDDTELANIADEIRAQLGKLKYLFTLK